MYKLALISLLFVSCSQVHQFTPLSDSNTKYRSTSFYANKANDFVNNMDVKLPDSYGKVSILMRSDLRRFFQKDKILAYWEKTVEGGSSDEGATNIEAFDILMDREGNVLENKFHTFQR